MRKRSTPGESLDQKIEKAQTKVNRTKTAYEKAVDELQILLDKRDARRKDEIWAAIIGSNKSYEEILDMIKNDCSDED